MRIRPAVGSVVGQSDATHWGQVLLAPFAYGVVEVADADGIARQHGIRLLTEFTHALGRDVASLHALAAIADSGMGIGVETVILLVPVGRVVYVVLRGVGKVLLKRDGKLATLVNGSGAISGELELGDTLLLVSHGFTLTLTNEELVSVFDHLPAHEVAEKLTILLHERQSSMGATALVFQVTDFLVDESDATTFLEAPHNDSVAGTSYGSPIGKLRGFLKKFKISSFHPERLRRAWHSQERGRRLKTLLVVGITFLFLLSVVLGIWKQSQVKRDQAVVRAIQAARQAFEEGTALLELNATKGKGRLLEGKKLLEPILSKVSEKSPEGREVKELYQELSTNLTQAMKIYTVHPEVFYDVSLLRKGAVASTLAIGGDTLAILDRQAQTVYTVSLTAKSGQMLASGGDLAGAFYVTIHGGVVDSVGDKGIVEVKATEKKPSLIIKKPAEWGVIGSLVSYGGSLYLLDVAKGRIWKYVFSEKGPSSLLEYLAPDTFPDFSHATSLAIDGSVWVATSDGKILKFTQGKDDTFHMQGVDPPLGNSLRVYTDDTLKNIYVLDTQEKRVVVIGKDGIYLAQYAWPEAIGVADFSVSEEQKRILLLSEGKIFSVALQ